MLCTAVSHVKEKYVCAYPNVNIQLLIQFSQILGMELLAVLVRLKKKKFPLRNCVPKP